MATNGSDDILLKNCRSEWPSSSCIFFNICGLCSTAIWFLVLIPQIWKNYVRKSVAGLSIMWATANFSASMINIFFVFGIGSLPLYAKINSVYMPVLEAFILIQFYIYDKNTSNKTKMIYASAILIGCMIVIATELGLGIYKELQWAAIILWSIETFPQVILNMRRMSTSGQSSRSVSLALIGKTTDFLSTYGLVMPFQFVVMCYFSSSLAYINGIQVAWYYHKMGGAAALSEIIATVPESPDHLEEASTPPEMTEDIRRRDSYSSQPDDNPRPDEEEMNDTVENVTNREGNDVIIQTFTNRRDFKHTRIINTIRYSLISVLCALLLLMAVSIVWAMGTFIALIAPVAVILILVIAKVIISRLHIPRYSVFKTT